MSQELGYPKLVRKLKDLGLKTYTDEQLPYGDIYRGAWKGTVNVPSSAWFKIPTTGGLPVSGHYTPNGQQMKMLMLRVWTDNSTGAVFAIRQIGAPANASARGVTDGTLDYPFLEGDGAEVVTGTLKAPIHVTEGTLEFYIEEPAQATEYGVAWWGCEAPPTIQS
jgi:hypothetical protein